MAKGQENAVQKLLGKFGVLGAPWKAILNILKKGKRHG